MSETAAIGGLDADGLRRVLLAWYRLRARPLPWRRRPSLYGTWISEIMLQQTTVPAVIPRWEEFLTRFPDVRALAAAGEDEVLAAWSGLGYYRRARHLHQAARRIVAAGGALPRSAAGWLALPGVGRYAAGAIASIGLGEPVPAVDANARRVILRWLCEDAAQAAGYGPRRLEAAAAALVDLAAPGDWNQAVMELGATVCRGDDPRCGACPVAVHCRARRAGVQSAVPPPRPRPAVRPVLLSLLVVRRGPGLLLTPPGTGAHVRWSGLGRPVREDAGGLFAGLWSAPATAWYADPDPAARGPATPDIRRAVRGWTRWLSAHGLALAGDPRYAGSFRHAVTNHRLRILVVTAESRSPRAPAPTGTAWRRPRPGAPPALAALTRKALRFLD